MLIADNVSEILVPALDREWVDDFQNTLGIKNSIVFPIIAKEKVLGTLIFSLSKKTDTMSEEEWSILESFAGAVGIALDNALLFESLNKANKRLEQLDHLKDELSDVILQKKLTSEIAQGVFNIHSDRNKIYSVLLNLIDNAIKFTPDGGRISIGFKVDGNFLETTVSDTGIGIKQE